MKKIARMCLLLAILTTNLAAIATANEITDWNRTLLMLANLDGTKPLVLTRAIAIVQSAVFDAVNGIEPRYTAVHVQPAAPAGGSRRAAAVQRLCHHGQALSSSTVHTGPKTHDLLQVLSSDARETSASITSGINWGQKVADEILAWKSTDGSDQVLPPFLGGEAIGIWRPTPPDFIPGIFQQFATVTPWSINSPSQFQPQGPLPWRVAVTQLISTKSRPWAALRVRPARLIKQSME
jgi:hypothetical protein